MNWNWLTDFINLIFQNLVDWLWLTLLIPIGWLFRKLIKKYAIGFESEAAEYFEKGGRWTARKLLTTFQLLLTHNHQVKYFGRLIEEYRDYQIQGFKTKGPFVLDLEKVFVSLRISPQSLGNITSDMLHGGSPPNPRNIYSIWDLLAKSDEQSYKHLAVIGPPGSGKTTLLRHLTLIYAKGEQHNYYQSAQPFILHFLPFLNYIKGIRYGSPHGFQNAIPIQIVLRDHVKRITTELDLTLPSLLSDLYPTVVSSSMISWVESQLLAGKCLVMLDGLDEVGDSKQRKEVSCWINKQIGNYPHSYFIVTSRPHGYQSAPIQRVRMILEVQPFNLKEVSLFIENWYLHNEIMRRLGRDDKGVRRYAKTYAKDLKMRIKRHPTLAELAINPLLLTMIAIVHDNRGALPGRRVELYAELCDVMLGRRQEAKGILGELSATQNQRILQVLALELMKKKVRTVRRETASHIIEERLTRIVGSDTLAVNFIKQLKNLSGLLVEREADQYEFVHKSIQEYLASVEIKESGQEELLIDNLTDQWWEETIRLFIVQANDTNRLFQRMLTNSTVSSLAFAYDCLNEGAEISLEHRKALKDRIDIALESNDIDAASLAAKVLIVQRLKYLERVDDNKWIDKGYITCAEYQLFLNDIHNGLRNYQPDHWENKKFKSNTAKEPISGIRSDDAQKFCDWLNSQYPEVGFTFRLPEPDESRLVPVKGIQVGEWCESEKKKIVVGLEQSVVVQAKDTILHALTQRLPSQSDELDMDSALRRVLSSSHDIDEICRFIDNIHDDFERVQIFLEEPDARMSYLELARRYVGYDGSFSYLQEISSVFARFRSKEKTQKLALHLQDIYGLDRGIYLTSHIKKIMERDLNRDLEKDLDYVQEFVIKACNISISSMPPYWKKDTIADMYAHMLVNYEYRKGSLMFWNCIRIVKEETSTSSSFIGG